MASIVGHQRELVQAYLAGMEGSRRQRLRRTEPVHVGAAEAASHALCDGASVDRHSGGGGQGE